MNCQRFESVAADLARGRMMEADVRNEALAHSKACQPCALRIQDEEMLTRGLRTLVQEMTSIEAPASIEADLLKAFRQPRAATVPLRAKTNTSYRRYWLTAVAACLLIVFSVLAVRWRSEKVVDGESAKNQANPEKKVTVPPQKEVRNEEQIASNPTRPKPRRKRQFTKASALAKAQGRQNDNVLNHASSEVATEFMPLGYLNPSVLQDGGQIVRVEVPRATLANFGIPVNMDRYNERVRADILVAVDGTPRAIRFVQDKRLQ